ncbi:MAG: glycosyltransferase family 1 protein [Nitrospira sp.]|nr:glycosyltransferase family 1 protein [Nitrospira sp.]
MKILIATDAWLPQVNGVVRTLGYTVEHLRQMGHEVRLITPEHFRTYPCPTYPSIRLALFPKPGVKRALEAFRPQAVHIATEGPIGHAVRALCRSRSLPFTTSYHTQFPEYVRARWPVPLDWSYAYLRRFHGCAARTMVATESMRSLLRARGFRHLEIWARGVDSELFQPGPKSLLSDPRPISMYVGRVAVEKNIEAFLQLDLPGSKYVVGDGPDLEPLRRRYPGVRFTGKKSGRELAAHLAAADVFVFPSLTDTFGLVLLEAMACGVPVAAYPVTGPIDVVRQGKTGVLDHDLRRAVLGALTLDPADCVAYARQQSWRNCTERFLSLLAPFEEERWG